MHDPTPDPSEPENGSPASLGARMTTVDLEDLERSIPRSLRNRVLQVVGNLALIALALGIIANQLARAQPPLPPSATVAANHPVVLVSNVSFGVVTLNGTRLHGAPPVLLPLRQGRNQITFSAPPFALRACQLMWSGAELDDIGDCAGEGRLRGVRIDGQFIEPALAVALTVSGDDLPPALAASAIQAIIDTLARARLSTVNLGPDEFLATGGLFPAKVTSRPSGKPLRADIGFTLPNQLPDAIIPTNCPSVLCAGTPLRIQIASPELHWTVALGADYQWTYADAHGTVTASSPYYPLGPSASAQIMLVARPAGSWIVSGAIAPEGTVDATFASWSGLLCSAGMNILQAMSQAFRGFVNVIQDRGIAGCELLMEAADSPATGRFIWRCGVLLAADQPAHAAVPDVPVAPASVLKLFP